MMLKDSPEKIELAEVIALYGLKIIIKLESYEVFFFAQIQWSAIQVEREAYNWAKKKF
ncbi:hypothetical protein [Veronia pacifica]|uniref:hypothetical protein n=1 Tax=Veronia pacifica TaxID=1080227 RepID=UPI00158601FE|nr:hypothetical protein [Veronia pacifica]